MNRLWKTLIIVQTLLIILLIIWGYIITSYTITLSLMGISQAATIETLSHTGTQAQENAATIEQLKADVVQLKERQKATAASRQEAVSDRNRCTAIFEVTAYTPFDDRNGMSTDPRNGGRILTASGNVPVVGVTCAANAAQFNFGDVVYIEGLGKRVVQDRGGAIGPNKIDVVFADYDEAMKFGRKQLKVTWYEGD